MSVIKNKIFRNYLTWDSGDLSIDALTQEIYITGDVSNGRITLPPITGTGSNFEIGNSIKFIDTGDYFKNGILFSINDSDFGNNIFINGNNTSYTLITDSSTFEVQFNPSGTMSNGDLIEWYGEWFIESYLVSGSNSISEENISNLSISENKIQDDAVTNTKLSDDSVTTSKILNGDVTNSKLSSMAAGTIKGRITTDGSPQDLTVSQVKTLLGAGDVNGLATLDDNGLVPSAQLPSYVDDVIEVEELPASGETSKIYVVIPTGDIYRWSGTQFVQINDAVSSADQAAKLSTTRSISSTGDATWTVNFDGSANVSGELSISDGVVTNRKLSTMVANTIKGRIDSDGDTQDLTADQVRTLINVEDGAQVNVGTNIAQGTRTSTTVPITSSTGTNATLSAASTTLAGVMSAADKSKLDGIAVNANNYIHPSFEDLSLDIDTGVLSGAVVISDLDFNIESTGGHVTAVNATYSTRELTAGDIGAQPAGSYVTTNSVQSLHSTDALRLSGNTISLYKGDGTFESITLTDNTLTTEEVQDIVGGMVTSNTELGIAVTYDDTNGKLNFNVNDPTITLSGDVTGSATMTNLGNVTISTTVADNSHNHTYDNITGMTDGSILFGLAGKLNQNNESLFWDNTNRRLGVNTNTPRVALEVNGDFAATTKSFLIDHPSKEGMKLRHGSLEGPENGVYVRGRLTNNNVIELPDYWIDLVDELSITVQLTSIGEYQELFVKEIKDNKVFINDVKDCYYLINAERKDVDKMIVEF